MEGMAAGDPDPGFTSLPSYHVLQAGKGEEGGGRGHCSVILSLLVWGGEICEVGGGRGGGGVIDSIAPPYI